VDGRNDQEEVQWEFEGFRRSLVSSSSSRIEQALAEECQKHPFGIDCNDSKENKNDEPNYTILKRRSQTHERIAR
jgi:hypothetical protein